MTPRLMLTVLTTSAVLALACGGKLVDERAFVQQGERLTLDWETTVPEGEPSFWLAYDLHTGSEYDMGRGSTDPVYNAQGTLAVTTGGNAVYDGLLRLDDGQAPTTQLSSTVTVGSSETCGTDGCRVKGRVRTLNLDDLSAGSPLVVEASIPVQGDSVTVEALTLQMRAK